MDHAGLHFFRRVSALRRTLDGRRVSGAPTKLLRAAGPRTTIGVAASHGFLVGPRVISPAVRLRIPSQWRACATGKR